MKTSNTEFIDNRAKVLAMMNANVSRAIQAVGTEAVGLVVQQMKSGYGRPIRRTGDLMRDVDYKAEETSTGGSVLVGNGLDYAVHVHEGTTRMAGRHYLRDALEKSGDRLGEVMADYLKEGF